MFAVRLLMAPGFPLRDGLGHVVFSSIGISPDNPITEELGLILQSVLWATVTLLLFHRQLRLLTRLVRSGNPGIARSLVYVLVALAACATWYAAVEILYMPRVLPVALNGFAITMVPQKVFSGDLLYSFAAVTRGLAVSVAEELVYRGALFYALLCMIGKWPSAVVSSLVFGYEHIDQWERTGLYPILCTAGFALLAFLILFRTGRLRFCMLFHLVWNLHMDLFRIRIHPFGFHL